MEEEGGEHSYLRNTRFFFELRVQMLITGL
jgi:hypothetical protein